MSLWDHRNFLFPFGGAVKRAVVYIQHLLGNIAGEYIEDILDPQLVSPKPNPANIPCVQLTGVKGADYMRFANLKTLLQSDDHVITWRGRLNGAPVEYDQLFCLGDFAHWAVFFYSDGTILIGDEVSAGVTMPLNTDVELEVSYLSDGTAVYIKLTTFDGTVIANKAINIPSGSGAPADDHFYIGTDPSGAAIDYNLACTTYSLSIANVLSVFNLIVDHHLEEVNGSDLYDSSGNGYHGEILNTISLETNRAARYEYPGTALCRGLDLGFTKQGGSHLLPTDAENFKSTSGWAGVGYSIVTSGVGYLLFDGTLTNSANYYLASVIVGRTYKVTAVMNIASPPVDFVIGGVTAMSPTNFGTYVGYAKALTTSGLTISSSFSTAEVISVVVEEVVVHTPADISDPTKDVLGGTLTNVGNKVCNGACDIAQNPSLDGDSRFAGTPWANGSGDMIPLSFEFLQAHPSGQDRLHIVKTSGMIDEALTREP